MKKWVAITCAAVCVVAGGLWYADYRVKEAVGNQVASVLSDPSSQAEINNIVNSLGNSVGNELAGAVGNELGAANTTGAPGSTTGSAGQGNGNETSGGAGKSGSASGGGTGSSGSGASNSSGSHGSGKVGNTAGWQGATSVPTFTSRQQVVNYAISKFTAAQISQYAYEYAHRASLTQAQKDKIKADILSHFTPAEIAAMRAAADKYK